MSLNSDSSTALITNFQGSAASQDPYDIDPAHGLYCQNCDFILGLSESVQVAARRGTSEVVLLPNGDGYITNLDSWYFSLNGVENCYAIYYGSLVGVKAWDQRNRVFTSVLFSDAGDAIVCFVFDGSRAYAAFAQQDNPRQGAAGGEVYGVGIGTDQLFPPNLDQLTLNYGVPTFPGIGVITQGFHRVALVFTSRNGAVSGLNPVNPANQYNPVEFAAPDGIHNVEIPFTLSSIPSWLQGGTYQIAMSPASNLNALYLVPGTIGNVPSVPGTFLPKWSIADNDLVTGTDVTAYQNKLLSSPSGIPPFFPSAIFTYSSRMGYVTIDSTGFPVVYFSDPNSYQALSAATSGIYLEERQIPIQGASLGGVCYIATLSGLYATQDNGGTPATWTSPQHVDGSVGILCWTCMIVAGGKILLASEKGLFIFRGGTFPQIPLSYWQANDWNRINWSAPWQVQIVDDSFDTVIRVQVPLKVFVTNASNTNPIVITTCTLIDSNPVAAPHLFQSGLSVTISGVSGNTNANGTFAITSLSANTFSIPAAGNGAYVSGGSGYAGICVPNSPNAEMCWNYSAGDAPGEPFYSLNAFSAYLRGATAIVRNISTGIDEVWYAPNQTSPIGCLIRRVLPTDPLIHRDVDLAASPAPIVSSYETSLLPGSQDETISLHDYSGAHLRIRGQGSLSIGAFDLDHQTAIIPLISPITLTQNPGREYLIKWFLRSEAESIQFGTNALDAYFVMAIIRAYYTNSLPQRG